MRPDAPTPSPGLTLGQRLALARGAVLSLAISLPLALVFWALTPDAPVVPQLLPEAEVDLRTKAAESPGGLEPMMPRPPPNVTQPPAPKSPAPDERALPPEPSAVKALTPAKAEPMPEVWPPEPTDQPLRASSTPAPPVAKPKPAPLAAPPAPKPPPAKPLPPKPAPKVKPAEPPSPEPASDLKRPSL